MNNWHTHTLGDITTKIGSGATPRGGRNSYKIAGVALIRSMNVLDSKFDFKDLAYIDEYQAKKLNNVEVKRDDVLINITGASVCRCTSVPDEVLPARVNQHVSIIRCDGENLYPYYLKYYLLHPEIKQYLYALASTGATREALTKVDLETLEVKIPDYKYQTEVADIIKSYDDLLNINETRIKILEEVAEKIYREWFVNFKFPGYETMEFTKSETDFGLIPKNWDVKKLSTQVDYLEGPGIRNWQYKDHGVRFLNIRTMSEGDILLDKCNYLDPNETNNKYNHFLLKEGDIIVSSSGTLGRVVEIRNSHLPLCLNTSIIRYRVIEGGLPSSYIWQFLNSKYFQDKIVSLASGSAQLNYGPSHLSLIDIVRPEDKILNKYNHLVNQIQQILAQIRDTNSIAIANRDLLIQNLVTGKRLLKF